MLTQNPPPTAPGTRQRLVSLTRGQHQERELRQGCGTGFQTQSAAVHLRVTAGEKVRNETCFRAQGQLLANLVRDPVLILLSSLSGKCFKKRQKWCLWIPKFGLRNRKVRKRRGERDRSPSEAAAASPRGKQRASPRRQGSARRGPGFRALG